MKNIGRTVLSFPTKEGNPRNGEGSFVRLKDDSIMYVYTKYIGNDREDHDIAEIYVTYSANEGDSWTEPTLLISKDDKAENIMSPSLLRMENGDIGILYLRKEKMPDTGVVCMPVFRRSSDEGKTWSKLIQCDIPEGYYCAINDGAIVQKNGRILVPLSYHGLRYDSFKTCTLDLSGQKNADIRFAYSDDNGTTWGMLETVLSTPYDDKVGFAEPGVYEHQDGELWSWFRTAYGYQYESRSVDGGQTWSAVVPNFHFSSPDAPMRVKRVGEYTIAIFNPVPLSCVSVEREAWGSGKRTPLVCAVSSQDAVDFKNDDAALTRYKKDTFFSHCFALETDPKNSFCYPAIQEVKDGFLVSYYDSDNHPYCLNAGKMKKILYSEIYG